MTRWRLIESGPCDAYHNMALDEAIALGVREGLEPPTLRLYSWERPSVTIGSMQRSGEVDMGLCEKKAIPVVRRPTGGRGILHGEELTYSFSAGISAGEFAGGLLESYKKLSVAFSGAFEVVGLKPETVDSKQSGRQRSPLCFQSPSYGEITPRGRKVIGSAQRRWPGGMLQQGSIPLRIDYEGMMEVFRTDGDGVREAMAGLWEFIPYLRPEELEGAIRESFQEAFGVVLVPSTLSPREEARARELLHEKYLRPEWNLRK